MLKRLTASTVAAKPVEVLEEKQYYLIVCEGSRTEPEYFQHIQNMLPKNLVETIAIEGGQGNTIDVVRKAIELRDKRNRSVTAPPFDEVWAVYDKDDFPAKRFNSAIQLAAQEDICSGETNEAFELWYVLHFDYLDTAIGRADYCTRLSKIFNRKYIKRETHFHALLFEGKRVLTAIGHAEKLLKIHTGKSPANACPYTRVHELVRKLLVYADHPALK